MKKIMMWIWTILIPLVSLQHEQSGSIEVEIRNLRNTDGQIGVLVFEKDDGYPEDFKKALRSILVPIDQDTMVVTMDDLPFGEYVITVLHDENSNDKLDKSFFGKPKEGNGVSNDPKPGSFGPPKFKKGIITLSSPLMKIAINLRY